MSMKEESKDQTPENDSTHEAEAATNPSPQEDLIPHPHPSIKIHPKGFHYRPPPPPSSLKPFLTPDSQLFQTIHMGAANISPSQWSLTITGLVSNPLTLTFSQLLSLPRKSLTSFHECYGSPLVPPTKFVRRIGNVRWTGVSLSHILSLAKPKPEAKFVWSDGLDHGTFGGVEAEMYRKDLTIEKAWGEEVMVAYEINGERLDRERGGPVRLVVPGWFGTNSVKWVWRIVLAEVRAGGPFTTRFYNERDPGGKEGEMRAVWEVEPSSIITFPEPGRVVIGGEVEIGGWAWSGEGIGDVEICVDLDWRWVRAELKERMEFEWQQFRLSLKLEPGIHSLTARATSKSGTSQPLTGRRNHVHTVHIIIR